MSGDMGNFNIGQFLGIKKQGDDTTARNRRSGAKNLSPMRDFNSRPSVKPGSDSFGKVAALHSRREEKLQPSLKGRPIKTGRSEGPFARSIASLFDKRDIV